ncbi:MAG: sugar nucleotide-binding protein [Pseudomonadota bacterium]
MVNNIKTAKYPTSAIRPPNSQLETQKFADRFGWTAPSWRTSLAETVASILSE